jgi:hypothetical protein
MGIMRRYSKTFPRLGIYLKTSKVGYGLLSEITEPGGLRMVNGSILARTISYLPIG